MALTLLGLNKSTEVFAEARENAGMVVLDLSEARRAEQQRQADSESSQVSEALVPQMFMIGGDAEDARYKRITSKKTLRDLNPLMQERMQQICFFIATTIPFAKRFIELVTDYVVGAEGFTLVAKDKDVQAVLDRFVADSVNDLEKTLPEWSDELGKFGELCVPVAVNPVDGMVRLGYIDPCEIEAIEYGLLTAGDGREEIAIPVAVRLKQKIGEQQGRRLRIVMRDEDPDSETFGQLSGECFYLAVNKAKSASRGISDLFCMADTLDVLDQLVFDGADRARFMNSFIWQYIIKGADDKKLEEFRKKTFKSPPKQGGVLTTNDQVELKALSPDLKAYEFGEIVSNIKTYGLGGIGFPNHWFADPGDVNRATAGEMGEPTLKKLEGRQKALKRFYLSMVHFVIDKAQTAGVLKSSVDRTVEIQTPKLNKKDLSKGATTVQTTANSLAQAEDRGWIRSETAAKAFHQSLREIDIEIEDPGKEFNTAQREKQDRDATEIDRLNPQANLADALDQAGGAVQ